MAINYFSFMRIPIMAHFGYLLESRKYEKLEAKCANRINKIKDDPIGYFYMMYSASYRGNFSDARKFFFKLNNVSRPSKKTKKYFLTYVEQKLIENKEYNKSIKDCKELLRTEDNEEVKILLIRLLCEAYYHLWSFKDVREYCSLLMKDYSGDNGVVDFVGKYLSAVETEEKKRRTTYPESC